METSFKSRKELERFERISSRVSKKYVPIYSTKLVESLEPQFKYIGVNPYSRTGNNGSRHYITMSCGESLLLRIENSFDGTLALRISFQYNNFVFGFIRQVHIGKNAIDMSTTNEISEIYKSALKYVDTLSAIKFTKEEQLQIIEIVAKERGISIARLNNPEQYTDDNLSAIDFIEKILEIVYNQGVKMSKPLKNDFCKMKVSKKIYKFLDETYPELSL